MVLWPKSSLCLLSALPPGFSIFGFSIPNLSWFSCPSLTMNCLLQGFLWCTVFLHSDYMPC
jgi:hypothetical protein